MPTSAATITVVRQSIAALDRSLMRLAASLNGGFGEDREPKQRSPRKMSSRARAALKLQGRYMGYMRQLKPKQKAVVRALKEKRGTEAAIRKGKELAGGRKVA